MHDLQSCSCLTATGVKKRGRGSYWEIGLSKENFARDFLTIVYDILAKKDLSALVRVFL